MSTILTPTTATDTIITFYRQLPDLSAHESAVEEASVCRWPSSLAHFIRTTDSVPRAAEHYCLGMNAIETTTQHMIVCTIDILTIIVASGCCQSSVAFTLSQYSTPLIAIELTLRVTKSNNVMSTL